MTPAERPCLFSGGMVNAILAGRKSVTRRVVKPQPAAGVRSSAFAPSGIEDGHGREIRCPFGGPGTKLWVRETWYCDLPLSDPDRLDHTYYRADARRTGRICDVIPECECDGRKGYWKPSIFMPRWASRITLEVTGIRVERVQAITEEDARAEGVESVAAYRALWDDINGARPGCSWADSPWVWVVSFRRLS